jgi:hypothetical protein
MATKGRFPKMLGVPARVTSRMPPKFSAPVTGGSVPASHPHLTPGTRARGPKGMP